MYRRILIPIDKSEESEGVFSSINRELAPDGVKTLDPLILHSEEVSHEMRRLVADTSAPHTAKEVRVPLTSLDDVPPFMDLVRIKWAFARERPRRSPALA